MQITNRRLLIMAQTLGEALKWPMPAAVGIGLAQTAHAVEDAARGFNSRAATLRAAHAETRVDDHGNMETYFPKALELQAALEELSAVEVAFDPPYRVTVEALTAAWIAAEQRDGRKPTDGTLPPEIMFGLLPILEDAQAREQDGSS